MVGRLSRCLLGWLLARFLAVSVKEGNSHDTVDGQNPAPTTNMMIIPLLTGFQTHPRWLFGISEPSTVSVHQKKNTPSGQWSPKPSMPWRALPGNVGEISTPWGVLKIQTEDIVAKLENVKCFAKISIAALNDLDVEMDFLFSPAIGGVQLNVEVGMGSAYNWWVKMSWVICVSASTAGKIAGHGVLLFSEQPKKISILYVINIYTHRYPIP